MTPTQTYSVQDGNPFTAKDIKPRLIPEIKQRMCAAGYSGKTHPSKLAKEKTIEIKLDNIHEAILNTHRFAMGLVSHLSRRLSLRRDNKIRLHIILLKHG
jgi:hypothetical protein